MLRILEVIKSFMNLEPTGRCGLLNKLMGNFIQPMWLYYRRSEEP